MVVSCFRDSVSCLYPIYIDTTRLVIRWLRDSQVRTHALIHFCRHYRKKGKWAEKKKIFLYIWLKILKYIIFLWLSNIPLYIYTMTSLSIHLGHLGCLCVLAIVNNAAMNIGIHVSFSIMVFSRYMPSRGIVRSYGGSRGRGHMYIYGWFMLMYGRNQYNTVKQLSSN